VKKLILLSVFFSLFLPSLAQAEVVDDPFTVYIQEKLIALGLLEGEPTGINNQATQQAIKTFQEKAGLVVDGLVGDNTFSKLLFGESAYLQTSPTTTVPLTPSTTVPTGPDIEPPVWDKTQPPFGSEIGSLFNLNMPSVSDNVGIVSYEVYVNGALSTHVSISDSKLLVTPKYDMACADQLIYVIAFDEAGNSSQSPAFTIPQSDPCISVIASSSSSSSQSYFAVTFGGTNNNQGESIAVDSSGNIYITGYFYETVDFGGGNVTSAGSTDIFVLKLNSSGTFQWVNTYGGTSFDFGRGIAVDSSGNIYITGYFYETVDFGGGNVTSAGSTDIFVLKLNSSGTFQWVNTYGGTSFDFGRGIAVDSSGNIYITGYFYETVDFGGGNLTSAGGADIFVLKLNSSATFQWVSTFGSTSIDVGEDITVDSSGNSYITGYFEGTVDFGGGNVTSAGSADIFVLKLNSSGTFQWVNTYGGSAFDVGMDITVDSSGNSYITGYFEGTVDFGAGNVTSAGAADIFILKLNSSGAFQWVNIFGGTSTDVGQGIAVDSSGNSYITGSFQGTVDFGSGDITPSGFDDIFVLKVNPSGTFQWVSTFGGTSNDVGEDITVDSSGNSYITGWFRETVDFGAGNVTSAGGADIIVLKLNSSGTFQWVNTYGGTSGDVGEGITVDSSGNSYITGWFRETVDFGAGNVTSAGGADIIVLKLNSSGAGIE
jgi:peptidoglycan hydrolase-like protein with peptidoglycan-binding domain